MRHFIALVAAAAAIGLGTAAQARQDPLAVKRVVEDFLRVQTRGLPGSVSFEVGAIDPHNKLPACPALEAFAAPGARNWGHTTVGVRCRLDEGWSIYVPARVRVLAEVLVAARPLAPGAVLTDADLALRSGDLGEFPAGALTDRSQALGHQLSFGLPAGRPLRGDLLRAPLAVQQGQSVTVVSRGAGFQVSTDGRALNNAATGQVAQVRTAGGQTVSGIARRPGVVEVSF